MGYINITWPEQNQAEIGNGCGEPDKANTRVWSGMVLVVIKFKIVFLICPNVHANLPRASCRNEKDKDIMYL